MRRAEQTRRENPVHVKKRVDYRRRRDFIIELGKALHKFGTPAFRLEAHLYNVTRSLGLDGYFMATPTLITIVLWEPDRRNKRNYHIRVKPGDLDLGSLAVADQLVDDVISGECSMTEALQKIEEIYIRSSSYSTLTTMLSFGVTSGAFAMLVGVSMADVIISSVIGLVVFGILHLVERTDNYGEALEPLAAAVAALIASAFSHFVSGVNVPLVVLSGIIVFIPGLSITMALKDLAARQLMSGTARLMDSLMCLCKLYFGSVLGSSLVGLLWAARPIADTAVIPGWSPLIAVPLLSLSLVAVFKNRLRDIPWAVLAAIVAYAGSLFGAAYLGDSIGPFVGALAVGVYSNIFSRVTNSPSMLVLLHGTVLLVPGSKAYIGLNQIADSGAFTNLPEVGGQAFMIFMSILAGLTFSNVIVPSRKTL
ncbi:threonine/serine exporter family protein [Sansalvadorimonas sp. 2012CJ34-2]|uniref:Threonine/serine exporter family protein n=1 Tax=Parendozoicomonas callyspongiae TaxID=2942213 RepID=A0ABT0PI03_9GAMM|nr:threonine/serine exporter family protein [Sansalvadorimonas sp. 2012CJ34-2]MCL6270968.1 threonine/serine exporter family protein [Sansalvadorimonas sp. 2012CJ34-2]